MTTAARSSLAMLENHHKLYKSGELADFSILTSEDVTLEGAKFLFASQSDYFKKALYGSSKKAKAKLSEIDMSAWDHDVMVALVQYIYTGNFILPTEVSGPVDCTGSDCGEESCKCTEPIDARQDEIRGSPDDYWRSDNIDDLQEIMIAKIYALGSYAQLPGLQMVAKAQFEACMRLTPRYGFYAAHVIYEEVPEADRALKAVFVRIVNNNLKTIFGAENEPNTERRDILDSIPELSMDLTRDRLSDRALLSAPCLGQPTIVYCKKCLGCVYRLSKESLKCPECWTTL